MEGGEAPEERDDRDDDRNEVSSKKSMFPDFEERSLFCLGQDHAVRQGLIRLVQQPAFDYTMLAAIVLNALALASQRPLEPLPSWQRTADLFFTVFFTVEMTAKIIAMGFAVGQNSYLHSGWNVMDATVVVTGWLPYLLDGSMNSSALRVFRLLRPLRSINRFPALNRLVVAIMIAIPQLSNLVMLTLLFFVTFAIVGIQLLQGAWAQRCHTKLDGTICTDPSPEYCAQQTLYLDHESQLCSTYSNETWARACSSDQVCTTNFRGSFSVSGSENPFFGLASFDSLGNAMIAILQIITLQSWVDMMEITQQVL